MCRPHAGYQNSVAKWVKYQEICRSRTSSCDRSGPLTRLKTRRIESAPRVAISAPEIGGPSGQAKCLGGCGGGLPRSLLRRVERPDAIAYIVEVAEDESSRRVADEIAAATGGTVRHVYTTVLHGFAIAVPAGITAQDILADPRVIKVERDTPVSIPRPVESTWHHSKNRRNFVAVHSSRT